MTVSRGTYSITTEDNHKILLSGAERLGINIENEQAEKLLKYLEELKKWNKKINLVSKDSDPGLIINHILDSLAGLGLFEKNGKEVLDIGSGAGLPGLMLAVMLPMNSFTLSEPRKKRAQFIKHAARTIKTENIDVWDRRIESGKEDVPAKMFDYVTFRGLGRLKEVLPFASVHTMPGGSIIAYKGPKFQEEIKEIKDLLKSNELNIEKTFDFQLPFSGQRRVILKIRKYC